MPAKAAVIGAGPAGLACADYLARRGVNVTVYDKERDIGGLLSYGIPPFKLSRDVVARRRALLNELGVKLVMATTLGKELDFESIRRQNDAVFVATGAGCAVGLSVPGGDLPGVLPAMVLLGAVSRRALGESNQMPDVKGKRVVVLGGGDTDFGDFGVEYPFLDVHELGGFPHVDGASNLVGDFGDGTG